MLSPSAETHQFDESEVVREAVAGSADAFTVLFDLHYPAVYRYAYRLCLRQADAEDLTQETFIKAARGIQDFSPDRPFANWLLRICTNAARDFFRRQTRRVPVVSLDSDHDAATEQPTDGLDQLLRDALLELAPETRSAVVLVFYEGMTHGEAATVLGCAEATVSWRIFRAKRLLKRHLQSHE